MATPITVKRQATLPDTDFVNAVIDYIGYQPTIHIKETLLLTMEEGEKLGYEFIIHPIGEDGEEDTTHGEFLRDEVVDNPQTRKEFLNEMLDKVILKDFFQPKAEEYLLLKEKEELEARKQQNKAMLDGMATTSVEVE